MGTMRLGRVPGLVFPTVQTVPSSGLLPKADFSSPGSAIAYCAYSFPDTLVRATFRDYYLTLAVLNTIGSTGLSCYSRYLAAVSQMGGGGASCESTDYGRGQCKKHSGAGASVPQGLPVAGQDQLQGHTACVVAQGPTIQRGPHLV